VITTKINEKTKKKLLELKVQNDKKSISDVIDDLIRFMEYHMPNVKKEETKNVEN
jgi:hypothetical protein